jgi:hypothetical protein
MTSVYAYLDIDGNYGFIGESDKEKIEEYVCEDTYGSKKDEAERWKQNIKYAGPYPTENNQIVPTGTLCYIRCRGIKPMTTSYGFTTRCSMNNSEATTSCQQTYVKYEVKSYDNKKFYTLKNSYTIKAELIELAVPKDTVFPEGSIMNEIREKLKSELSSVESDQLAVKVNPDEKILPDENGNCPEGRELYEEECILPPGYSGGKRKSKTHKRKRSVKKGGKRSRLTKKCKHSHATKKHKRRL